MNLLLMNLSHYWKRPILFLLLLLFTFTALPMAFLAQKGNFLTPALCGFAMIGGIVYGYQMEILSKPFSFLLPGHRRIFRHLVFTVQAFWLLLGAILVLVFSPQDMLLRVFISILILAGGSLAFRLGTKWADKTRQPQAMIGFMVPIIVFVPMLTDSSTVEKVLFDPLVVAFVAVAGCIVTFRMWRSLGDISLFASYCGLQNVGFLISSQKNMEKVKRQQFAVGVGEGAEDFIAGFDTFFLKRIERTRQQPIASFVYGALYQAIGPGLLMALKNRYWGPMWIFAIFLLFGYYGRFGDYIIWFIFIFSLLGTDVQVYSTLLVTRGRTQRYIMAMSWILFTAIKTLAFVFICLGLTKLIEPYMPAIHLRGLNADFHTPDWRLWYLFGAGAPLLTSLRLLLRGETFIYICGALLMAVMFSINVFQWHLPNLWIGPIVLCAWAVFSGCLYWACFRRDQGF
jgi:hypothetical protein